MKWLASFKQTEGQVARWLEYLSAFQFKIEHRSGTKHLNADALSRLPGTCSSLTFGQWSQAEVQQAQSADPTLSTVIKLLQEHAAKPGGSGLDGLSTQVRVYVSQWEQLQLYNNLLYRKWYDPKTRDTAPLLIVPREWVPEVLKQAHDAPSGGHFGIRKTLAKLLQKFYWSGMRRDVQHWVKSCLVCGAAKNPVQTPRAPLVNMGASEPMERVAIDLLGPFPLTERNNRYILVVGELLFKVERSLPLAQPGSKIGSRGFDW